MKPLKLSYYPITSSEGEGVPRKRVKQPTTATSVFKESRRPHHPFADRPSPWEEMKQTVHLGLVTFFQFLIIDVIVNGVLYYLWKAIEFTLLSPIALIGLVLDSLHSLC